MNKVRIENLNIKFDQEYYGIDDTTNLLKRRDNSILTKKWFFIKLRNNELVPLYDNGTNVYIHVDRHDSMSGIHFYDAVGDPIMTYPWNGKISGLNEGQLVNEYQERFGDTEESRLRAINVVLRNGEIIICDEIGESRYNISNLKHKIRLFDRVGNEKKIHSAMSKNQIEIIVQSNVCNVDAKYLAMKNDEKFGTSSNLFTL